ncbi:MAG TPA: YbdK family carboxylate-amine ligase [Thermoleophilaceae bacterium]|jgi:glutamate---cysteine ligase / carboxylate-amine ligase|nr:YbdK family carboxylate-amine ligase [Thermoleophilaceae bacterium]
MEHAFGGGTPFSIGLEEELLLVDRHTLALAHVADRIVPKVDLPEGRAGHEAFLAEIELRSDPCPTTQAAVRQLAEGRAAAQAAGATLMAVGLHPESRYGDVTLVDSERYRRVEGEMRGLIRRTPECALHVHVGLPSPEAAVAASTGLREALPLIMALGASSPFWFGLDSGLASARSAMVRGYPGRGAPPPLRTWDDYLEQLDAIAAGGGPTDRTMVWWDVRLQPRLGTVELRELDVQTRLEDAAALAALVRALARRAVEQPVAGPSPAQAIAWSWFRASRDGLGATIAHEGRLVSVPEAARATVARLGPQEPALEGIERILAEGNGADRQRAAFRRGGMAGLLRFLAEETARPADAESSAA